MSREQPSDMQAAYDVTYKHHASAVQTEVRRETSAGFELLRRRGALLHWEGETMFEGWQKFWVVAHTIAAERRLSRFVFHARKP